MSTRHVPRPDAPHAPAACTWLKRLGAGLITGAADDDPSGIATYSQAGAKYGFATLWSVLVSIPLMVAIQAACALIGRTTGQGLAQSMRKRFPAWLVRTLAVWVAIANIFNLGADIAAMGAAIQLLAGGPRLLYSAIAALVSLALQVYVPFSRYSPYLKVLTFSLFAYVGTLFVVTVPWKDALIALVAPRPVFSADYAVVIVAVLGTTISPYLFYWQAAQEVEELRHSRRRTPLKMAPAQAPDARRRIRLDTMVGMVYSNAVAFCIMLTAAVVLHAHGKTDIQSSVDAAAALRPVAGPLAFALFATGIVGTGLLAVPVLAGSTAYFLADAWGRPVGLEKTPGQAKAFYGALIASVLLGTALTLTPIDPMKALFWSAVINGVAAVPLMAVILLLAGDARVMGECRVAAWVRWGGWAAVAVMAAADAVMFATLPGQLGFAVLPR
jgi:NRAMP (natural resistance-associated macrophage protein)-like metal ion transporter